jgi:hypothetical protein
MPIIPLIYFETLTPRRLQDPMFSKRAYIMTGPRNFHSDHLILIVCLKRRLELSKVCWVIVRSDCLDVLDYIR